jgi:hypothetical protein
VVVGVGDGRPAGLGTTSRSDGPPPPGALIEKICERIPPAALRMSWRSVTVSSSTLFIEENCRPM